MKKEIIIYGAGAYGGVIYKIFKYLGIEPDFFCDKKGGKLYGIPIISYEELLQKKTADIYIATKNYYVEIKEKLRADNFEHIMDIGKFLNMDIEAEKLGFNAKEMDMWNRRDTYLEIVQMEESKGINMVHVELVVTEYCNLHCTNCSSLIPYYKNPTHMSVELMVASVRALLEKVNHIGEMRILGGEPFLMPQLGSLIEELSQFEQIGMVTIYTNGTVIPNIKVLETIRDKNIFIHISNYGIHMQNRNKFVKMLDELQIDYGICDYEEWKDFGEIISNNFDADKLEKMFERCGSAQCYSILNGKLYRCPRSAHGNEMMKIKASKKDYVELLTDNLETESIRHFLHDISYVEACKFCKGVYGEAIKPAIQMN